MAASTITITGTADYGDDTVSAGSVVFTPQAVGSHFANGGVSVACVPRTAFWYQGALSASATSAVPFVLARCPASGTYPQGGYSVVEFSAGAPVYGPYLIPDQAGPVDLSSFH